MVYEWPEKRAFVSSFACKSLPRTGNSRLWSAFVGPVWNLLPMPGQFLVSLLSWLGLYGLYYVYSELMPINKLNSTDGRYVNLTVCWSSAVALYYFLSFVLIYVTYTKGCAILIEQADTYLYSSPKNLPSTLSSSAWPLEENESY